MIPRFMFLYAPVRWPASAGRARAARRVRDRRDGQGRTVRARSSVLGLVPLPGVRSLAATGPRQSRRRRLMSTYVDAADGLVFVCRTCRGPASNRRRASAGCGDWTFTAVLDTATVADATPGG
ncbi:hypothetical protein HBB16_04075 [Pseudonocardia sp. MCCB 268]|nr:hypothetical protein [Pseudonocardia cytotoxica]